MAKIQHKKMQKVIDFRNKTQYNKHMFNKVSRRYKMVDFKQQMIDRHESLWTNGQLVRTKHKNWELYELVDSTNSKNRTYITKAFDGNWAKCGKPRGNSLGVFTHATPMPTFKDLQAKEIAGFPDYRNMINGGVYIVVSPSTALMEAA